MNLPTSIVITGCDSMEILQQALAAARSFKPMSKNDVASLLAKNFVSRSQRSIRTVQNQAQLRRYLPQSAMAGMCCKDSTL